MYEIIFACRSKYWGVIIVRAMQLKYMFWTHANGNSAQLTRRFSYTNFGTFGKFSAVIYRSV